jgi:DNA (cytosine-5)-methyltransferase 3A
MVAVPVGETKDSKSYCLTAGYSNGSGENIGNYAAHTLDKGCKSMVAEPVNTTESGKSQTIKAQSQMTSIANIVKYKSTYGASGVAEPVCVAQRGRYADTGNRSHKTSAPIQQYYEPRQDGKTNALTTVQKDNAVCETVRVGSMPRPNGELSQSQGMRVYSADGKSVNLLGNAGGAGAKTGLYAIPVEFKDGIHTKAISNSDGKAYTVYRVANGIIQIKDKEYPIKLQGGFYIIRKLSVSECKRLQTVPEWYEFPVSNAQAYKMLGNGWTVDVIAHLIKACLEPDTEFVPKQLSFF